MSGGYECEDIIQDRDAADSLARALRADVQALTARAEAAESARAALEAENEAFRIALKPFAQLPVPFDYQHVGVRQVDVEQARALLARPAGQPAPHPFKPCCEKCTDRPCAYGDGIVLCAASPDDPIHQARPAGE